MPNNRKTQDEFESELLEKRIGEYKVIGKYTKLRDEILIKHIKCGYEWAPRADSILNGCSGCPKCSSHKACFKHVGNSTSITIGMNDLWDFCSRICKIIKNYFDGYRVGKTSRKSAEWKCPNCGHIQARKVHSVTHNGLYREMCNDGFNKPEKFMRSVLLQPGVNFQIQKRFKWASDKKYDFYFDGIICEVHGLQHYERGFQCVGSRSLEEEKQNDILKEKLAKENGFTDKTPNHIYMLIKIPPKYSVSEIMGYLKGKSSLIICKHANLKYKYGNRHFWCREYYVDTVGKNTAAIKAYIQNQLKEDLEYDQMSLDPTFVFYLLNIIYCYLLAQHLYRKIFEKKINILISAKFSKYIIKYGSIIILSVT